MSLALAGDGKGIRPQNLYLAPVINVLSLHSSSSTAVISPVWKEMVGGMVLNTRCMERQNQGETG